MRRERLARRPPAGEGSRTALFGSGHLGGKLVGGGRGFHLFELQLELVEQPFQALRSLSEDRAPQLLDLQLEVRDQNSVIGELGTNGCDLGFRRRSPFLCSDQRRLERVDVIGKSVGTGIHAPDQIIKTRCSWRSSFSLSQSAAAIIRPPSAARSAAGAASRCLQACSPAGPA